MATRSDHVGDLLRDWRRRRRFSQMDLACEADVSTRHLSFVERGRAAPSRGMLLRLAEPLRLPLRERNRLLLAAGYAPVHSERGLDAPSMAAAKAAVEAVLTAHAPYPALAVDQHWNLIAANEALSPLLTGVAPHLLETPINVLRLSLAPDGLAPAILNLAEWRHHLLMRLRHETDATGDTALLELYDELKAFPAPSSSRPPVARSDIAVPLVLRHPVTGVQLSMLSTTTIFGTATDVTLAELTLECFYPADEETRTALLAAQYRR